jgi:hypothetical protein
MSRSVDWILGDLKPKKCGLCGREIGCSRAIITIEEGANYVKLSACSTCGKRAEKLFKEGKGLPELEMP